jgi:hypothetical protein
MANTKLKGTTMDVVAWTSNVASFDLKQLAE